MTLVHTPPPWYGRLALTVALCAALGHGLAAAQQPAFQEKPVEPALLAQMREGGFVIYIRHTASDSSRADRAPTVDFEDCSTQRVLSAAGQKQAVALGQNFTRARIPVGEVIYSPFCRTRDTAQLAFGAQPQRLRQEPLLAYTAYLTTEEKRPLLAGLRNLLTAPVPPGTNRVIIAHAPNLADLIGYFPKPEGTLAVFRPQGPSQFEYLGSIVPSHWSSLLPPASER